LRAQSSPGFIPERLTQARISMELSVTALSELIGVSRQSIDQFERGLTTPSEMTLSQIAENLRHPREFFFKQLPDFKSTKVFYRSNSKARNQVKKRVEVRMLWLSELVEFLDGYVNLPNFAFPNFDWIPIDPREINQQVIEKAAEELRKYWGIGENHPIPNLTKLLEFNGLIIATDDLCDEGIEALSSWGYSNRGYILVHKYTRSAVRMRFGIAHELGHLVLHKTIGNSDVLGKEVLDVLEDQANAFAGAFLIPKNAFARDAGAVSLDRLRIIKTKWLVSVGAMIKRAENIGLLPLSSVKNLFINYSRRGWRHGEPLDDSIPFEEPKVIPESINLLLQRKFFAPEDLEKASSMSFSFTKSLIGSRFDVHNLPMSYQSLN
jgi:Zn-dependent peptidase ImmA (M78 family)/DNA-binding XRE family transcriptional regulator